MTFIYEEVPQADKEKYGIEELAKKYRTSNFSRWAIDRERNTFVFYIRSSRIDDGYEGYEYYLMNWQGHWLEVSGTTGSSEKYVKELVNFTLTNFREIAWCDGQHTLISLTPEVKDRKAEIFELFGQGYIAKFMYQNVTRHKDSRPKIDYQFTFNIA
jgi:hypothetical protein